MTAHHPPFELLFDHATGSLPEAVGLAVASHLEVCAECRKTVADAEAIGGALLEDIEPLACAEGAVEAVLSRLDVKGKPRLNATRAPEIVFEDFVPRSLRPYLDKPFDALDWHDFGGLFKEAVLPVADLQHRVSLLHVQRDGFVPMHEHGGNEYLAVLSGGFRASGMTFERGDFAFCEAATRHEPVVDTHDHCICLLVLDEGLNFMSHRHADLNRHFQV